MALITSGARRALVERAFTSFVPVPEAQRSDGSAEPAPTVAFVVRIDTDDDRVRVVRRRDASTFERRVTLPDPDGYALALIASELLELARSGVDPALVDASPSEAASQPAEIAPIEEAPVEPPAEDTPIGPVEPWLAFTLGLGAEAWLGIDEGSPWLVQGVAFVEVLGRPTSDGWLVGGALLVSTLGSWSTQANDVQGSYARHDVAARLSVAGDVGPVRTRLLAHLRAGGSAVVGRGAREAEEREAIVGAWFVGLGIEARQPLVGGLELWLELSADALPAPVRFTALGETLIAEAPARVAARLGLAWRVE